MKKKVIGLVLIGACLIGVFFLIDKLKNDKKEKGFEIIITATSTLQVPTKTPEPTQTPEPTPTAEPTPTVVVQEPTPIPTTDIQMVESGKGMSILEMKLIGIRDDWEDDVQQKKEKIYLTGILFLAFLITVILKKFFIKKEKV